MSAWHTWDCQCDGCQQERLRQHYGQKVRSTKGPLYGALVGILLVLVMLGAAIVTASFCDPNLNFPVVSQVVCSLKGDTWYSGGLLGSPGCYALTRSTRSSRSTLILAG